MKHSNLSLEQIIEQHNLPHYIIIRFAIAVAKDSLPYAKDPAVEKCLVITEAYMKGRSSRAELLAARDAVYAAASAAYASYAAHAAYAAANAAYAANAAAHAAADVSRDYSRVKSKKDKEYRELLLTMINNMSRLEKLILNIN